MYAEDLRTAQVKGGGGGWMVFSSCFNTITCQCVKKDFRTCKHVALNVKIGLKRFLVHSDWNYIVKVMHF